MPYLIDGNNLMHALRKAGIDVGRSGLCRMLGAFAGPRRRVCVVFDGAAPRGPLAGQIGDERIEVVYSHPQSADDIIVERIAADSAPRRLTVVSTDRAIRTAARRRRCTPARSEEFIEALRRALEPKTPRQKPEPPEKRRGLTPEQTDAWMRELGLDGPDPL